MCNENRINSVDTRLFYLHLYLKRRKANSFVLFCLQNARDCISSCSYLQQKISHVTRYKSTIEEKRSCLIVKYSIKLKHVNDHVHVMNILHRFFAFFSFFPLVTSLFKNEDIVIILKVLYFKMVRKSIVLMINIRFNKFFKLFTCLELIK